MVDYKTGSTKTYIDEQTITCLLWIKLKACVGALIGFFI